MQKKKPREQIVSKQTKREDPDIKMNNWERFVRRRATDWLLSPSLCKCHNSTARLKMWVPNFQQIARGKKSGSDELQETSVLSKC